MKGDLFMRNNPIKPIHFIYLHFWVIISYLVQMGVFIVGFYNVFLPLEILMFFIAGYYSDKIVSKKGKQPLKRAIVDRLFCIIGFYISSVVTAWLVAFTRFNGYHVHDNIVGIFVIAVIFAPLTLVLYLIGMGVSLAIRTNSRNALDKKRYINNGNEKIAFVILTVFYMSVSYYSYRLYEEEYYSIKTILAVVTMILIAVICGFVYYNRRLKLSIDEDNDNKLGYIVYSAASGVIKFIAVFEISAFYVAFVKSSSGYDEFERKLFGELTLYVVPVLVASAVVGGLLGLVYHIVKNKKGKLENPEIT